MTLTGSKFEVVGDLWFKPSQFFSQYCPTSVQRISGPENGVKIQEKGQICSKIGENVQNGDKNCHFGPKMTKSNKNVYFPQK